MIGLSIDLSDLEAQFSGFSELALPDIARDLEIDAETFALERINRVIYDSPQRYYDGDLYIRTHKLKDSIRARAEVTSDGLMVTLETGAGAGGRHYGLENELGRGNSRVDLGRVLRDARASADPLDMPTYPREDELEARPFIIPAMAAVEDELERRLLDELGRFSL